MFDCLQDEKAKRKAEVRARLEQAAAAKKKRGFMTPARKKKLRVCSCLIFRILIVRLVVQNLLRKKAAEELKREQERKAEERRKIIRQRTGEPKALDVNEGQLASSYKSNSLIRAASSTIYSSQPNCSESLRNITTESSVWRMQSTISSMKCPKRIWW